MPAAKRTRIELCGRLVVELSGRRVEEALPGRQGRLLLAYLALERSRPTSRDELIELLWPRDPPADPDESLSALLSKLRRAVGAELLEGRTELSLSLPADAWIDLIAAEEAVERAEAALAGADPAAALPDAQAALEIASRGFFTRYDNAWVAERGWQVDALRLRALEALAAAGLGSGTDLAAAERAARALVDSAPLRESGYRLLIEAQAARGNVAEALQTYDRLRVVLRDELGTSPGAAIQALHGRLLAGGDAGEPSEREVAIAEPPEPSAPEEPSSSHPGSREERKLVTVLLAELLPAPADGARVDPEELRAALAPWHERIRAELERRGAAIESSAGSALMAVFGAPRAHEDDPQRAVSGALRVAELVRGLEGAGELEPEAMAALATGEALVSLDDSPGGRRSIAGEVVSRASRLARRARAGDVIVDEPTYRATRRSVEYEPLEPGSDAITAWRAQGARPTPAGFEPVAAARFVGREHELELLRGLHRTAADEARPRLVTILGQAGVGKTRLTDELVSRLGQSGAAAATVYRGRCMPYGEGITYWALREILWQASGIRLDDPATAAAQKLAELVGGLLGGAGEEAGEAERVAFALAVSSGIPLERNPLDGLSPESIAEEVGLAWPRFLSAVAAEDPVTVMIEDLHWAEPPLLEMVEQIISRSSGRLLVIATARPELAERRPGWGSRLRMSQVWLEPLTEPQSRELLEELLPDAAPELRDRVARAAEGNPFFAEEIGRHLAEEGALAGAEAGEAGSRAEIAIPPTVRAVLAARIDALDDPEKRVLQDAAVVGRSFWVTTLESMRSDPSIRARLAAIEEKGLVVIRPDSSLPGETELWFRHALTREVAYGSIPKARRSPAHAAVAAWIERLAADRREEFVDLLAHHYEAAASPDGADLAWPPDSPDREGVRRNAVAALLEAGRAAHKHAAADQAAGYASRALALAATPIERLAALELRSRALHGAIRADEALAAYFEAVGVARELGDADAASRLAAYAALLCSRYGGAFGDEGWRGRSTELVEGVLGDRPPDGEGFEAGALLVWRSSMRRRFGPFGDREAGRREAERAVEIAERIDSPFLLSYALEGLWNLTLQDGFCEQADMGRRLRRLGETLADRVEAHETLVAATLALARGRRHNDAEVVADEVRRRAGRLSPHRRLHAACAQASCLLPRGRLGKLRESAADVLDLALEEREHICPYSALALAGYAVASFESGDEPAAARAIELLDVAGPPRSLRYGAVEMVRPLIGLEQARSKLEGMAGPRDTVATVGSLRVELQVSALGGEWKHLDELIADAHELAGRACAPALAAIADWSGAVRRASEGDFAPAVATATEAAAALERSGEPYTAARLLVDLLPSLDPPAAGSLGTEVAGRLERMGAQGSAAEARRLSQSTDPGGSRRDRPRAAG